MKLLVKEIFDSIQGEGYFAGTPTSFIRLAGCSVKCPIKNNCDTDYDGGCYMTIKDIISKLKYKHACITGGEPLEHDIEELLFNLKLKGYQIHLQTSGLINMDHLFKYTDWVVCSPKAKLHKLKISRIDEMKVVYYGQNVTEYYKALYARYSYLQPYEKQGVYNINDTLNQLYELIELNQHWRLSLQLHKYISLK